MHSDSSHQQNQTLILPEAAHLLLLGTKKMWGDQVKVKLETLQLFNPIQVRVRWERVDLCIEKNARRRKVAFKTLPPVSSLGVTRRGGQEGKKDRWLQGCVAPEWPHPRNPRGTMTSPPHSKTENQSTTVLDKHSACVHTKLLDLVSNMCVCMRVCVFTTLETRVEMGGNFS